MSVSVITLKPTPGFCIKSSTLQPAVYNSSSPQNSLASSAIPAGFKLFINIAWDQNVPPPDQDSFVPVVVSEGRQDTDKAGRPSLVFDCIFHKSIKTRVLVDYDFKASIIELALRRIEAQTSLVLSRELGTPNIASKGKLQPRSVSLASFLPQATDATNKPLIAEIPSSTLATPKSILKKATVAQHPLDWSWAFQNGQIRISISVPHLDRETIEKATFDIEPQRFILSIPGFPFLDVDLKSGDESLKKQRSFNVQSATAEWFIEKNRLLVIA